ncbi:NAD(P)/FAD-dependent oxidoreductase [Microbacterium lacus]|uniref:flavin-containing monooxygenase n=1 Tax=Microbacterium lacus TaxID=415217 RepID=UPI0038512DC9
MMPRIGIIGSGFGAIATATEFLRHGYRDVVLWERSSDLGGVWRDNRYPGAACDVPSPFYSFSWAPWDQWPRRYSGQRAILDYLRAVAEREGVTERTRFGAEVVAAEWSGMWTVTFADGSTAEVDILVSAVGQLSNPLQPAIPGADSFAGSVFHSADWPDDLDARGRRVAVIGAAATAVQAVPALVREGASVVLFQRTPSHIWPKPDAAYPRWYRGLATRVERGFFHWLAALFTKQLDPGSIPARIGSAVTRTHLRLRVKDPALRAALTPDYPIGCRRILFSNDFYPAIASDGASLVTSPITRIEPDAVITADGERHPADVLVYATGFETQEFLRGIRVTGPHGDLHEQWTGGARAHLGIYVPGFPNLLLSYGPNTGLGGSSIIPMLEAQARHMRLALDRMVSLGARTVEASPAAEQAWDDEIQTALAGTAWVSCDSWYRHPENGRITTNWPSDTDAYGRRVRDLVESDFVWA